MSTQVKAANLNPRQKEILNHARIRGEVQVEQLAETFNVTPQTIRRDLNQLRELGLLHRVHGGAIVHDGVSNLGYEARRRLSSGEKEAIAHCAAQLIPDDTSLFINIGTTTEQVARHLVNRVGLLVITNNINVVNTLRECETIQVMTAGGIVRREDGGIVGDATVDFIAQFKVDFAVVGASAIAHRERQGRGLAGRAGQRRGRAPAGPRRDAAPGEPARRHRALRAEPRRSERRRALPVRARRLLLL